MVPDAPYAVEIGKADIKREGRDLSIISYGQGVHWALDLAADFEEQGVEIEVVDLRSIRPLDEETILNSVRKTHRAVSARPNS